MYKDGSKHMIAGSKSDEKDNVSKAGSQYQSIDLKPVGVKSIENMGKGFVSIASQSDFVENVGINKVFSFENEKRQFQ